MVDPRMNKFKSMSLDEQDTTLEKSVQGALEAREEIIVAETTEAPQEAI
jgi:hypothetical protein